MSYFDFLKYIDKKNIHTIFELGSRDLQDAVKLSKYYDCKVYAFECNPDCLVDCYRVKSTLDPDTLSKIELVEKAVSITNGPVNFFPFDLSKYDNKGSSSMYKIDFSTRNLSDPDYNRENPQKEVIVEGIRLDTFLENNGLNHIDLLCIDLQGYELNALKSLGKYLHSVDYIITECSIQSTYAGGATFTELMSYLSEFGFEYKRSNNFGSAYPDLKRTGFSEFDTLFVKKTVA
jgi:FkbM family methyltransferase